MPRYHQLLDLADAALHELVVHPERRYSEFSEPELLRYPRGKVFRTATVEGFSRSRKNS